MFVYTFKLQGAKVTVVVGDIVDDIADETGEDIGDDIGDDTGDEDDEEVSEPPQSTSHGQSQIERSVLK